MGAYSTIRVTRERALAAYAAHLGLSDSELEQFLNAKLHDSLVNVQIVWDERQQSEDADWYLGSMIGVRF